MNYDIVGDVHGHAAELEALLAKLGYAERAGAYAPPPGRHLVFVGDLIDRGAGQLRVLAIARAMQDAGHASIVMGNHEFNAVGWATADPHAEGRFLRDHRSENRDQHEAFLAAVTENTPRHRELVAWIRTLPLWLDLGAFRVVHACWHAPSLAALAPHLTTQGALTDDGWLAVHEKGSPARNAAEIVLKGLEVALPAGHTFRDKQGHERRQARVRWWDAAARTIRAAAITDEDATLPLLPDDALPPEAVLDYDGAKPVFFGHYWLRAETPLLVSELMACLDYSVAKNGHLLAYRFDGESTLGPDKLVWV